MEDKKTLTEDLITSDSVTNAIIGGSGLDSKADKTRARNKSYVLDLRIHSPASLGYLGIDGIDTAPALIRLAKVKGLDVIAVTDFYSGQYIDRIRSAATDSAVTVIPGVVIRTVLGGCNDVVLSCLFPESYDTQKVQEFLAALSVPAEAAGNRQHIVQMKFQDILKTVDQFGGVTLPSRMDKTPHRMAALPALVEEFGYRTFDLAFRDSNLWFKKRWPKIKFNLFSFSNANALAQVGSRCAKVKMLEPGFAGVQQIFARAL